jgi:carbon storage regulator
MLVLTRSVGQSILIGDQFVVTIHSVTGEETVRLGIEAPKEIKIQRAERCEPPRRPIDAKKPPRNASGL